MKQIKKDSLSYVTLSVLERAIDGYVRFEDFAYNPGIYAYHGGRVPKKSSLAQAIRRLKNEGYVSGVKAGSSLLIKLTVKGKELMEDRKENKAWDGRWRVVVFDIPEQKRIVRNLFRRNLKKWGFNQVQKSVWVSQRDVYQKLVDYIEDLGISDWVKVFETSKTSWK